MNRQRRKVKQKRQLQKTGNERLERETRKLVNKANARLDSLQRRYKKGTWSSKKLANRLSLSNIKAWSKSGKIKIGKNPSKTKLLAINKAVNQFLKSSTSTKKGINKVRERTIESLQASLSTEDVDLSYEDAETFYEMFGNDDFQSIADKIGASSLQAVIEDATEENDSESDFIKRLEMYGGVMMNDLDIRDAAISLYEKYVL